MNLDEFTRLHDRYKEEQPRLFSTLMPDRPATPEQLDLVEGALRLKLPKRYREFLALFGGGYCGFVTVFSADPASDFYLPRKVREAAQYLPDELLPFSDDSAGGYYAFRVSNGQPRDRVSYWNYDGGIVETEFNDMLDFIARYAYEPA